MTPAESTAVHQGSSPRMRGALVRCLRIRQLLGIIPAYAGSTPFRSIAGGYGRDHPRVCGEHFGGPAMSGPVAGSSPRMRGAHELRRGFTVVRGIIPAYAGSTAAATSVLGRCRDHPRVCGEHFLVHVRDAHGLGSSPRMRGARDQRRPLDCRRGIIPAYAGSTS